MLKNPYSHPPGQKTSPCEQVSIFYFRIFQVPPWNYVLLDFHTRRFHPSNVVTRLFSPDIPTGIKSIGRRCFALCFLIHIFTAHGGTLVSCGDMCTPKIPPGTRFKYISAGYTSYGISTRGVAYAWGIGDVGEATIPNNLTNAVALTGGDFFTLALKNDGSLSAWGEDSQASIDIPPDATNVTAIASAGNHCLALKADGTVTAWGDVNTAPSDLSNVVAVAAGIFHNIALKSDGTVITWGGAPYGSITVPDGLSNVVAISGAWDHTIALKSDGTAVYWGNTNKTIGSNIVAIAAGAIDIVLDNNANVFRWDDNTLTPLGYSNILAISTAPGENNVLLLQKNGNVICFGDNNFGESIIPGSLTNIVAVAAGGDYTVALKSDGTLLDWGVGNDTADQLAQASNITAIAASSYYILGLTRDHTVLYWPDDDDYDFLPPENLTNAIAIAMGGDQALALRQDGTVVTWGNDNNASVPPSLHNVTAIAAGDRFYLALDRNGHVTAWGDDSDGACDVPSDLTNAVAIAAGEFHSVALKSDGTVIAWGDDFDGETDVPPGLSNVVSIASSCISDFTLALQRDGTVVGWGYSEFGPFPVTASFANVTAIATGDYHSVAIVHDTPSFAGNEIRSNGSFQTDFFGDPGRDYIFQTSTNLSDWNDLMTLTCTNSRMPFVDSTATGAKQFYRVKVNQDPIPQTVPPPPR